MRKAIAYLPIVPGLEQYAIFSILAALKKYLLHVLSVIDA